MKISCGVGNGTKEVFQNMHSFLIMTLTAKPPILKVFRAHSVWCERILIHATFQDDITFLLQLLKMLDRVAKTKVEKWTVNPECYGQRS